MHTAGRDQRHTKRDRAYLGGKYDQDGRRVAPTTITLSFQTVETVNESAQERQRALDLFGGGRDPDTTLFDDHPSLAAEHAIEDLAPRLPGCRGLEHSGRGAALGHSTAFSAS